MSYVDEVIDAYNAAAWDDDGHPDCEQCRQARADGYMVVAAKVLNDLIDRYATVGELMTGDIEAWAEEQGIDLEGHGQRTVGRTPDTGANTDRGGAGER